MPNKRTMPEALRDNRCPECGAPVERRSPRGPAPIFCNQQHKDAFGNRMKRRGGAMLPLILAWRIDRGSGEIAKKAFSEICSMADLFNEIDRKAGRPRADFYAAKLMRGGARYIDRMKPKEELMA